jgi:hypothetical protein
MLFRIVIGGIVALTSLTAQIRVAGRVVSDTNAPVPNAAIELRSITGERYRAVADPSGVFAVEVRSAGEYVVDVERRGFFALKNVRLQADSTEWHLVLNPIRDFSESVDVTSSSSAVALDQASPSSSLSGANLVDVPYPTTHNLKNAMRILPGVVQDQTGGIHVNGGGEDQVQYLMDGFNIGDPLTGRLESRLSVEAVQSMDVMSGRFPAEYGKGSAGVLSVNTKMGDDRIRYSATNFIPGVEFAKGLRIGSWTPRVNLSGPMLRGRAWFSDSLTSQYDQTVVRELPKGQDESTSWRYSNLLRTQVNLTPSNILYAGFLVNWFSAARTGLTALDPAETTVDRRSRQWFADIKDQVYFGHAVLEFGYASNRTFARQRPQGDSFYVFTPTGRRGNFFVNGDQSASRSQFLANAFLPSFSFWGNHQVKLGTDLDRLTYNQNLRRTGFEYYSDTALVRRVTYTGDGNLWKSNFESSMYLMDGWRVRRNVLLELGLRADRDRILRNWNVSPRLGAAWSPGRFENTKLSGGYAVTYDATSLEMFTRPLDQVAVTTYFPPYGLGDQAPIRSVFTIPPRQYASPRFTTWSASIDQQLAGRIFIKVQGLRRRGKRGLTFEGVSPAPDIVYALSNFRADAYDSAEFTVRQNFHKQYEWMASYTRSRAASTAVVDLAADQPALVANNLGRLPWDAPNRIVSWGYLPTFRDKWSIAYLAEYRTGFPFSVQNNAGFIVGPVNSLRYPAFFELNLHLERQFKFRGQMWALRAGVNNITGHKNPNTVINDIESDRFRSFYGGQGRATVLRIRWLGKL